MSLSVRSYFICIKISKALGVEEIINASKGGWGYLNLLVVYLAPLPLLSKGVSNLYIDKRTPGENKGINKIKIERKMWPQNLTTRKVQYLKLL